MEFNFKNIGLAAIGVTAVAATGYGIYRAFKKEPTFVKPAEKAEPVKTAPSSAPTASPESAVPAVNTSFKNTANTLFDPESIERFAVFMMLWRRADTDIAFDPQWENGTGYFDHACSMVELKRGETARSQDEAGRKILLIGTSGGTIVIFKRYSNENNLALVSNSPKRSLVDLQVSSPVKLDDVYQVVDYVQGKGA